MRTLFTIGFNKTYVLCTTGEKGTVLIRGPSYWNKKLNNTMKTKELYTFVSPIVLTRRTDVLLETLIIFLPIFLKAHLLFGYPGIWLPSLFLELCLCVKQAGGLTCKSAHRDWSWPRLIYQWIMRCLSGGEKHCGHRGLSKGNHAEPRLSSRQRGWRGGKKHRWRGEDMEM